MTEQTALEISEFLGGFNISFDLEGDELVILKAAPRDRERAHKEACALHRKGVESGSVIALALAKGSFRGANSPTTSSSDPYQRVSHKSPSGLWY